MQEKIKHILSQVIYPNFQKDIISYGFLKDIKIQDGKAQIFIEIPSNDNAVSQALYDKIDNLLQKEQIRAEIYIKTPKAPAQATQPKKKNLVPHIKHFIMVSSGKGGVGKSTASTNLAIALAMQGKKVGILDTDVYGPNIPRMFGLHDQKPQLDPSGKKLLPLKAFGVEVMSIGVLYDEGQSLIWRGPMLMRAIEQMLSEVVWGELDILVLDMPPGTGDAQLSIAQNVPISAGIAVMTPQQISLDDGLRSLDMFDKLSIPIAGIIENMSSFICPCCHSEYDIFGKNTILPLATKYNTKILATIPLEPEIRESGDSGKPIVYFQPESKSAKEYIKVAVNVLQFLDKVDKENLADNSAIQPH
ncbi:Mrp/NBP35 family ATP-binding protein [uncultured Helicobacter sp.]|uniref:Mrp/NBP35 family ATP-binding protein n=1 Tax=uncultured Helicobacter sp. TaxID=175537 RepID=UPI0027DEA44F|nr:Mrp/NBP35 family ATP-binding protein [uncultured Helicobacter sp.]